jgi:hypothetical protein
MTLSSSGVPTDSTNQITKEIREYFDSGGDIPRAMKRFGLTRPSVKHYYIEWKQARGHDSSTSHGSQKRKQIRLALDKEKRRLKILELFSGKDGELTQVYQEYGKVDCYDKAIDGRDSFQVCYELVAAKKKYHVVDIDPYGYPTRMLPHVFLLIDEGYMFFTMPKLGCNMANQITAQMVEAYFGDPKPTIEQVLNRLWWYGICHWREISLIDVIEFSRMWRLALRVNRVKATEYCQVRNRPDLPPMKSIRREPPKWKI